MDFIECQLGQQLTSIGTLAKRSIQDITGRLFESILTVVMSGWKCYKPFYLWSILYLTYLSCLEQIFGHTNSTVVVQNCTVNYLYRFILRNFGLFHIPSNYRKDCKLTRKTGKLLYKKTVILGYISVAPAARKYCKCINVIARDQNHKTTTNANFSNY